PPSPLLRGRLGRPSAPAPFPFSLRPPPTPLAPLSLHDALPISPFPGRAAGMPDPDHAAEPEILSAVLAGDGQADQPIPDRQQYGDQGPGQHHRRQPARGTPALGRCPVLLRNRP